MRKENLLHISAYISSEKQSKVFLPIFEFRSKLASISILLFFPFNEPFTYSNYSLCYSLFTLTFCKISYILPLEDALFCFRPYSACLEF